jgi:hypothetical protein
MSSEGDLIPRHPRCLNEVEHKRLLVFAGAPWKRKRHFSGAVRRPLEIHRQALLYARNDIMIALKLEGAIVIEEPVESAGRA